METEQQVEAEELEIPEEAADLLANMPTPVQNWLLGRTQEEPPELASAMDQVAEKINMATAFLVVQRLAAMSRTYNFLQELEQGLFDTDRIKAMDAKERMAHYRAITKESNDFLEFSRKFTLQNKEMFTRQSQSDELAGILRELPPEVVQEMLKVFTKKGAGTTVNDLKPAKPAKIPTDKSRREGVLSELMGDDE